MIHITPLRFYSFCALALFWGCVGSGQHAQQSQQDIVAHYNELQYPELNYLPPHPNTYKVSLAHQATGYFVPDSSLELTQISFYFKNSNLPASPKELPALGLYNSLLVSGGTKQLTPQVVEDSLEFVAGRIYASLGDFSSSLSVNALSKDVYPLLNLLKESILHPGLDKSVFELNKKKYLEGIKHRYDSPGSVLSLAYNYVMKNSHPSNWLASSQDVKKIRIKDLGAFKKEGFYPEKLVIAVSGMYEKDSMVATLNQFIEDLKSAFDSTEAQAPEFKESHQPGVYIVDKEFSQATVKVGFPGLQRPHPDYYKLTLASYIFGAGGFTSKLTAKVRSEKGLAYTVRSFTESNYLHTGTVGFYLQTKVTTTGQAISLCFEEMEKLNQNGITQAELERAKKGLVQSLPSMFSSPASTARIFAQSEVWNREADHFINYPKIIESLTLKEVNEAFSRYFKPELARIVIVGELDKITSQIPESGHPTFIQKSIINIKPKELEANL